jgi:hypothetical protein
MKRFDAEPGCRRVPVVTDESDAGRVVGWRRGVRRVAPIFAIGLLLIVAAIYMGRLADYYACVPVGSDAEWPDESLAVVKLLVGTCLFAIGVAAAFLGLRRGARRGLFFLACVCALPVLAAWVSWMELSTGCPS